MKRLLTRIADRLDALEAQGERIEAALARLEHNQEQLKTILVETHSFARELHSRFIEQADRSGQTDRDHERRLKLLETGKANGAGGE